MHTTFSGERLRQMRKAAGWSGERLAVAIGRSLYSVSAYEAGRSTPSAEVVARAADALGGDVSDLFDVVPDEVAA